MSISTWRHRDTSYKSDMETHRDTWRHMETHRDTWRHMETHRDTQRHGDTPYKICSQIKTDIYDAISSLTLIGPMS